MAVTHATMVGLMQQESLSLHRYLARKLGTGADAEDVLQDAFIRLLGGDVDETQMRSPRAYLFSVASNLAIDAIRRRERERNGLRCMHADDVVWQGDSFDLISDRPAPHEIAEHMSEIDQVLAAVQNLPEKCRSAFLMHRFLEMPYTDIAKRLGVTVSMVEKHLSRALHHVRRTFAGCVDR